MKNKARQTVHANKMARQAAKKLKVPRGTARAKAREHLQ